MSKYLNLIEYASQYIGVHRGTKDGDLLIKKWLIESAVDCDVSSTYEHSYCVAFAMHCVRKISETKMPKNSSVLFTWKNTPEEMKTQIPAPGYLFFWDFENGTGHIGIVKTVLNNNEMITIEGNTTNPNIQGSERNGGYVMEKTRKSKLGMIGNIRLLGFVDPYI